MKQFASKYCYLLALFLVACSSSSSSSNPSADPGQGKELTVEKTTTQFSNSKSDDELIGQAKWYYGARLYTTAEEAFDTVLTEFPESHYTEFALIKVADGYFLTGTYTSAAKAYADFISQHPNDRSVEYAYIRQAHSLILSYGGLGRDVSPLEKSDEVLVKFIRNYPQSIYLTTARNYLIDARKKIVSHNEWIAEFYSKKEKFKAADGRWDLALKEQRETLPEIDPSIKPILNPEYSEPLTVADLAPESLRPEFISDADSGIRRHYCNEDTSTLTIYKDREPQPFDEITPYNIGKKIKSDKTLKCGETSVRVSKFGEVSPLSRGTTLFFAGYPARIIATQLTTLNN